MRFVVGAMCVVSLLAAGGAAAADLPSRKAAPVDYVRVCSIGEKFAGFVIPGTDTCLSLGGRVRSDTFYNERFWTSPTNRGFQQDTLRFRARGYITTETRTPTEIGVVRTAARFYVQQTTGGNTASGTGANGTYLDYAFVQAAGFTAGRYFNSFFDFAYASGIGQDTYIGGASNGRGSDTTNGAITPPSAAYTARFGGLAATVALEDSYFRESGVFLAPGPATTKPSANGGTTVPDLVGRLEYGAGWGVVALSLLGCITILYRPDMLQGGLLQSRADWLAPNRISRFPDLPTMTTSIRLRPWQKDALEKLVKEHDVGFFILADEEPTINKKKFVAFCEELIRREVNILWGINTRVTDILRDEELLPMYRKAGLIHVSLGTEAAAQLKLDRFNKETKVADNKRAVQLLRDAGIVVEAQFIVGLENETRETLEETYRMAMDWKPDLANWSMYTPWPFTSLFRELSDKVEIYDFEKYNFVTPIIKPEAMDRAELLDRVMHNYRRFYMYKAFFSYPWAGTGERRRYLLGCLKAFLKSGFERKFYDLGKVGYWGPQSKKKVDFHFDGTKSKILPANGEWRTTHNRPSMPAEERAMATACGGGVEQMVDDDARPARTPVMACGGGTEQMSEDDMAVHAVAPARVETPAHERVH